KLKWAHVYETSEPFHTASVWAAQEIGKRTNGRYAIDVYPASQLGKETDINQGLSLGSVDMIISGSSFAAKSFPPIGVTYYPYTFRDADHLLAYTKSDVFKELTKGYEDKKFYEVQKHIVLTGHIVDHLNTVVSGALWKKLSEEDRKIFTDVAQEAAAKATAEIKANEAKLVDFFKQKGLTVTEVNKDEL